jgi:hypothetical protein
MQLHRGEGQSTETNMMCSMSAFSGVGRVNADNLPALDGLSARKSYEPVLL